MRVLVLNGSPKGKYSITLQTSLYLEKKFPEHQFRYLHAGQRIKSLEKNFSDEAEAIASADLLIFSYPVYTFIAPSQLHRFIELLKASGLDISGKFVTQVTTSKHFYDVTAHKYIQENCQDLGMKYIRGLSADMDDLLTESGRRCAEEFFKYVCWCMKHDIYETISKHTEARAPAYLPVSPFPSCQDSNKGKEQDSDKGKEQDGNQCEEQDGSQGREQDDSQGKDQDKAQYRATDKSDSKDKCKGQDTVQNMDKDQNTVQNMGKDQDTAQNKEKKNGDVVIVTDCTKNDKQLNDMINRFRAVFKYKSRIVNISEYPFQGGCLGCFNCAADGKCIYKDGFDDFLRNNIQAADAIIYAFSIRDHSMGSIFKMYDDRQFCNGHRTVTMDMPVGYLVSGNYPSEANLQVIIEARSEVAGNFLAGVACDQVNPDAEIDRLAARLEYVISHKYVQPRNFFGVGGMKIFRDLIWIMRGLMKADHRFYKKHGLYDFPQKKKGTVLKMHLVGALMSSPRLKAKMGKKMNEGMIAPYKKVLKH